MSAASFAHRYWQALTGARLLAGPARPLRGSLWQRYWASLLGVRLPPGTAARGRHNPLTRPRIDGPLVWLPRFDRAALRLAATSEPERLSVTWALPGHRVIVRESGPDQVDVLAETDQEVPAGHVLPVRVAGPGLDQEYLMVFSHDPTGRWAGTLRLAGVPDWIDLSLGAERAVTTLDATDPVMRAVIQRSVRATPDPGMPVWAEIVSSRPPADPLREVIENAAR